MTLTLLILCLNVSLSTAEQDNNPSGLNAGGIAIKLEKTFQKDCSLFSKKHLYKTQEAGAEVALGIAHQLLLAGQGDPCTLAV